MFYFVKPHILYRIKKLYATPDLQQFSLKYENAVALFWTVSKNRIRIIKCWLSAYTIIPKAEYEI